MTFSLSLRIMGAAAAWAALCALSPVVNPERETQAVGEGPPLHGVFSISFDTSFPPVVIIPGSGPTNRDGDNSFGIKAGSYRLLAQALRGANVASLRIDKRGMFSSASDGVDPNAVTMSLYAEDMRRWIATAREISGADCAWLLGHSEGGLTALVTAKAHPEGLCGVILVSAPGRRLGDVLREQLRANPANAPLLDQAFAAIDALEAGRKVDTATMHPALLPLFYPAVQDFLISVMALDPAELVADLDMPVLILQGETDLQVSVEDAKRLAAAQPEAELRILPGVNHVLKEAPADRAANLATYADPNLPLAPGVAEAIAAFVKR